MAPDDLSSYVPIFMGAVASANIIFFGARYLNHRLTERIDSCIEKQTDKEFQKHEKRIGKLETAFKIIERFFIPKDKQGFINIGDGEASA